MSLTIVADELTGRSRARAGLPSLPPWVLPRPRLNQLLDVGTEGLLTVVSAPTGAGKTLGVASWAAGPSSPDGVVWLNLARAGADPDLMWRRLHRVLREAGEGRLPRSPAGPDSTPSRVSALVELGEALRDRDPWTVVLDGFPTGTPSQLGSELEIVLDHAGRALRLVLLCRAEPALDLHRLSAAGDLVRVTDAELVMGGDEISGVLRLANAAVDQRAVAVIADHTVGWACGVRRVAVDLAGGMELTSALREADRDIEDYLVHEVLRPLSPSVRGLLVWTSVAERVAPGVVRAVLGPDSRRTTDRTVAATGLVQRFPDGSLRCHPLLRAAARAQLAVEQPAEVEAPRQPIVGWFADHGATEAAVELSVAAEDWARVASILMLANVVPQIMAGTCDEPLRRAAARAEVQAAEPLLKAALALERGDLLVAGSVLARSTEDRSQGPSAHALATAFLQLGIGRLSGHPVSDPDLVSRTRTLLAEGATTSAGAAELSVILDALAGAVDATAGRLEQAVVTLARGADHLPGLGHPSAADCAGQLALLEAFRGNLDAATRRASEVLSGPTRGLQAGRTHAHVATAWVHAERGDHSEAMAGLARAEGSRPGVQEAWLSVAMALVEARVLIATGRADEALRVTASASGLDGRELSGWPAGLVTSVSAEALLASGEPQQALALVTSRLPVGSVERAVLTALARQKIGDVRGAGAAITSAAGDLPRATRTTQLQGWLLDARLAHERGQLDRALLLVDRVLRVAAAEKLRRPLAGDGPWLRRFLDRDGAQLREYLVFVRSLPPRPGQPRSLASSANRSSTDPAQVLLDPLTERETQVLELLAQMCSTDEIAAELFVSVNTVKTHLKGIFRKFDVNRRVDAVRRGRELGLC